MDTTEPTITRLVSQTRRRFYLEFSIVVGISTTTIAYFGHFHHLDIVDPLVCFIHGIINLILVPFILLGYDNFSGSILILNYYAYSWTLVIERHDFITGPLALTLISCFYAPNIFLFDKVRQDFWCKLIFVSNIVIMGTFLGFFFPDQKQIVLEAGVVKQELGACIYGASLFTIVAMRFNALSSKVYEDAKRTNEAIESSAREKEAFFATISHEIRNPLQSLLGSVELLQDFRGKTQHSTGINSARLSLLSSTERDSMVPLLEICKNCSALVINMVSNILDLSKISAGKMVLSPISADLREILGRLLSVLQGRASGKNLSLKFDCDTTLPPAIEVDTQRIEQVVVNLVSNAIKFTSTGRVVVRLGWIPLEEADPVPTFVSNELKHSSWTQAMEFSEDPAEDKKGLKKLSLRYLHAPMASARGKDKEKEQSRPDGNSGSGSGSSKRLQKGGKGLVKIEVMDTGIGIAKENAQKLFKPFQQADTSISRQYGGTGLGLWIAKNILLQMKGDINVKSKAGKGSNFIVAFPVTVSEEINVVVPGEVGEEIKGVDLLDGRRYLLLDDIPENTFILTQTLSKYGIKSQSSHNGLDALEKYKSHPEDFDGIITDLRMPLMSGQSFIKAIRGFEKERGQKYAVPIIVMTAESASEEKKLCLTQYGANEFLLKPVKLQDLVASLVRVHTNKPSSSSTAKNILIVDDEMVSAQFLQLVLTRGGHNCAVAHSLQEAKEILEASSTMFDIIILDNLLPDGTGANFVVRTLEGFVKEKRTWMPKVISMSGNSEAEQRMMYAGVCKVDAYMQKPIKKRDILDTIRII